MVTTEPKVVQELNVLGINLQKWSDGGVRLDLGDDMHVCLWYPEQTDRYRNYGEELAQALAFMDGTFHVIPRVLPKP